MGSLEKESVKSIFRSFSERVAGMANLVGRHPCVAWIHRAKLAHNMKFLQQLVGKDRPLWLAVKANAYGHGVQVVSDVLSDLGYTRQCVAHVNEAQQLFEHATQSNQSGLKHIVILSAPLPQEAGAIVDAAHVFEPVVCTTESLDALAQEATRQNKQVNVHIKVDSGMHRIGCMPKDLESLMNVAISHSKVLCVKSIMSHFACADNDAETTQRQLDVYLDAIAPLQQQLTFQRHIANSAGIIYHPQSHLDVARPGIAIYGLNPGSKNVEQLQPILELESQITCIKSVGPNAGVSYGHTYHTTAPETRIANVAIGYGDGLSRALSNRMHVWVNGVKCPQIGRITMDNIVIDVSKVDMATVGTKVSIIGGAHATTADDMATMLDTINYEITTSLSQRVARELVV